MSQGVGVDGCRGGWLAVWSDGTGPGYAVFPAMTALVEACAGAGTVCVDIPIGLPWHDCPVRPCDHLARVHLRHRHVSVFPAPSRDACLAVRAGQPAAYARQLNQAAIGKSLSAQALGICAKVAEVDVLMRSDARARGCMREVHPEVCFWALNGERPIDAPKSSARGREERLALLQRRLPWAPALLDRVLREERRAVVQADDVLDALVASLVAAADPAGRARLAGSPGADQEGLPMEMLFVR